ncbi:hypothetical protein [Rhodococcus rhodnii]|uniref:hypothetical protein n=1 Tax=Rhodococcus rhodnii TaxID=38312 RepID=UPI00039CBEE4|nr:hypothetical protein [Rhodococcus rhodnii]
MTETTHPSIYDPKPGVPYGTCMVCDALFADRAAVNAHHDATRPVANPSEGFVNLGRSHTVRITNPTRPERIRSMVEEVLEEALRQYGDIDVGCQTIESNADVAEYVIDDLERSLDRRELTRDEAMTALAALHADDVIEAWEGDE